MILPIQLKGVLDKVKLGMRKVKEYFLFRNRPPNFNIQFKFMFEYTFIQRFLLYLINPSKPKTKMAYL